jgi:hypothetical protein
MFNVICVSEFEVPATYPWPVPQIGIRYTVIVAEVNPKDSVLMYELKEFPHIGIRRFTFEAVAFAPCTGHDESVRLAAYLEEQTNMDKTLMALAEHSDEPIPQDAFDRNWSAIKERLNLPL